MADSDFDGFANAPEGKAAVDVKPFKDKSPEGKVRDASQTTKSSIVEFKTDDKATNGAPAAVVPAPKTADAAEGKEDAGN
jgi:hypothetical protein